MTEPQNSSDSIRDYKDYIAQGWLRNVLQQYELLRRLRDDLAFRRLWVENEAETRDSDETGLSRAELADLLHAYLHEFEFRIVKREGLKPAVHISPKRFRGRPYSWILGIESQNLSSGLSQLIDSAVSDVLKGYGKGSVLTSVFGSEFGRLFNAHVTRRMKEEFSR